MSTTRISIRGIAGQQMGDTYYLTREDGTSVIVHPLGDGRFPEAGTLAEVAGAWAGNGEGRWFTGHELLSAPRP